MRRVSARILVAACTFTLGFAVATPWVQSRRPFVAEKTSSPDPPCVSTVALNPDADISAASNLPIIDYCEVANNPERYSGKVVRISATLGGFIHGILLAEENCPGRTAVAIPRDNEGVKRALIEAAGSEWYGHVPLDLIVVGRFEKVAPSNESDLLWHTAPLHFEIMRVEKASKAR